MTIEDYLKNQNIFIATPCYGGSCGEPYLRSVIELVGAMTSANIPYIVSTLVNESLITRARNKLIKKFLQTNATHLFFIDSDIRFNYIDVLRLVLHDKDVVVGAYPLKSFNLEAIVGKQFDSVEDIRSACSRYVTNFVYDSEEAAELGEVHVIDGLIETYDAGTGFMCIKREVIEKMIDFYKETTYIEEKTGDMLWAIFDTMIDSDLRYLSEDFAFCRRWQKMGGKIWLDPQVKLDHFGTIVYSGNQFKLEDINE